MTIKCPKCHTEYHVNARLLISEHCPHCQESLWKHYDTKVKNTRFIFQALMLIYIFSTFRQSWIYTILSIILSFVLYLIIEYYSLKSYQM